MTSATSPEGETVIYKDTYVLSDENGSKCCPNCAFLFHQKMSTINRVSFEPLGPPGLYLGNLRHIHENSNCPLCQFFYSMRFEDSESDDYHLMAWLPLQLFTPDHGREYPKVSGFPGSFMFGVTAGEDRLMSGLKAVQLSKRAGLIAMESPELRNRTQSTWIDHLIFRNQPFYTRKIEISNLDYNLLRRWIQSNTECETDWSRFLKDEETLQHQLQSAPIYVIDCLTREVVAWTSEMRFVALSYVWGLSDGNTVERARRFPYPLPERCPLVIEDSITVVRNLGLQYLWVDQYCICQWDATLKQAQISRMDAVYRWAKFTIIAAAGHDSQYGLPGVSRRQRLQQCSANINGKSLLATLPDMNIVLQNSKWNTRAWTYQERFFSNLCLVFTDYQAFYECQNHQGYQCESASMALVYRNSPMTLTGQTIFPVANLTLPSTRVNIQFEVRRQPSHMKPAIVTSLESHITRYTSRNLTYDSDAINGISAVLREFQLRGFKFLNGVPLKLHHDKLGSQKIVYENYSFPYGLCWTHELEFCEDKLPRRRQGFPSWSWAGWTRSVTWLPQASDQFHPSTSDFLEISYQTSPGKLSLLSGLSSDTDLSDEKGKLLRVKAVVLHLQFDWAHTVSDDSYRNKRSILFLRSVQKLGQVPLHLTRHTASRLDFQKSLTTDTWIGLLLGRGKGSGIRYVLVVGKIEPNDNFLERVGIIQVLDQWFDKQELHEASFWLG